MTVKGCWRAMSIIAAFKVSPRRAAMTRRMPLE
jgi:hypothetical protein